MSSTSQGTVLAGRYRLERRIQTDPDGSLWRARDATLDRLVCVRVLRPGHPFAADVADAARRAALVDDPRLVRVLDVGNDGTVGFVVSENVQGETLASLTERGLLPGLAIRRIVGEVAEGLAGAAGRGLHHLRLNPRSVMICADGSIKLIGVAVEAAAAGLEPDHAASANRVDAVGLIALIYSGLTGRWPLGDAGFPPAPHGDSGPIAPGELVRGVPNDLDTLCAVTLGPRNDGPRSPAEVARQLAPWPSADEVVAAAAAQVSTSNHGETPRPAAPANRSTSKPAPPAPSSLFAPITPVSPEAIRYARNAAGRSGPPPISRPAGGSSAGQAGQAGAGAAGVIPATTPIPSGRSGAGQAARQPAAQQPAARQPAAQQPGGRPPGGQQPGGQQPRPQPGVPPGSTGAATRTGSPQQGSRAAEHPAAAARPGAATTPGRSAASTPDPGQPHDPARTARPGNRPSGERPPGRPGRGQTGQIPVAGTGRPPRAGSASGVPRGTYDSGELLMPWTGTWTPAPQNNVPADATGPFPILIPADGPPHEQSRLVLVGVATALVLGLVLAVFSLRDFGGGGSGGDNEQAVAPLTSTSQPSAAAQTRAASTPPAAAPTPSASSTPTPSSDPPEVAAIKSLDPQGDDKDEHTADSPQAVDGDPSTEWTSNTYNSAAFGGLKKGVGLSLRLKKSALISRVAIDVKGSGGTIQLRGGDAADYASSKLLDSASINGGTVTLTNDSTDRYSYVILWITKLPTSGGQHRAEISEVRVT